MRRRRGGRLGTIVACLFLAALLIWAGGTWLRTQHYGDPAKIRVDSCVEGSNRRHFWTFWSSTHHTTYCNGMWNGRVKIYGTEKSDIGHDVDVHVDGKTAVKDDWKMPLILVGIGSVAGIAAIYMILGGGRRRNPT